MRKATIVEEAALSFLELNFDSFKSLYDTDDDAQNRKEFDWMRKVARSLKDVYGEEDIVKFLLKTTFDEWRNKE